MMDAIFLDIFKISPILGLLAIMWFYQRKDYTKLVEDTRADSGKREEKYQHTIDKLTDKINIVEDVKKDVEEIKEHIFK